MLVKLRWQYKLDEKTISAITARIHYLSNPTTPIALSSLHLEHVKDYVVYIYKYIRMLIKLVCAY